MFSQRVIEKLSYYLYFLQDPRDNSVFYVGKGFGNRVFQHQKREFVQPSKSSTSNSLFSGLRRKIYDLRSCSSHWICNFV